ncbi:hypothetical protein IWQ61_007119 [Dispira simplex]|nr:hypothetical protein IWQ61_007119 [Dispira simplex]
MEVAKKMLEVIKDIENSTPDKSAQEIITKFLNSDIMQGFMGDLIESSKNNDKFISVEEAIYALLHFIRFPNDGNYPYVVYNKEALQCLNSKKMAKAMFNVVNVVEKKKYEEIVKEGITEQYFMDEIADFLSSEIRQEFKEHLTKDSKDDDGNISEKAISNLLSFAEFYDSVDHPHYFLDDEVKKHLYSWEMANTMHKITNEAYKVVLEESSEYMIIEFMEFYWEGFKKDLNNITLDENEYLAKYEFLEELEPHKSATTKVTLMQLYFIANTQGGCLFSNEEFLEAVCLLNEPTNPSDNTQV